MLTISNLVPGGLRFNGVAVINFDGFDKVVEALGTVFMCVDTDTYSIHYFPNGERAFPDLDLSHGEGQTVGKHYPIGCYDMQPWEALDYSRQRHIPDGDYGRQRHQQQLLKAIVKKIASPDTITNFNTIRQLQAAAGDLLTLDLGDTAIEDWVLTLSGLRSDDIVMIKTNGGKFNSELVDGIYREYLSDESLELLKSVQTNTVIDFLSTHPDWVATDQ
jgi:anionic cell wall polymer biosynthesis LytR-Cps2A-Psr (LCP) family protein